MDRNRRIENSPTLLLEQQRLNREVTVLTGVFTTLKQQLETTKIEEVKESEYVIILDKPEVPLLRSKPQRTKMVIMSGVFGILLGIFAGIISFVPYVGAFLGGGLTLILGFSQFGFSPQLIFISSGLAPSISAII